MGKGTRKAKAGKAPRRPTGGEAPAFVGALADPPVDIELVQLRDLLAQTRRLSEAGRRYLAARLQEDVDLY